MRARDIFDIIESVAPLSQQEEWDNSGLQIGSNEAEVSSVLLCTDITEAVLNEAVAKGCQLVLSHHPLLFHGLKTIQGNTVSERCAIFAIQNDLVLYSSHTAMDVFLHGVSGRMAEKIGIQEYEILSPTQAAAGLGVVGNLEKPMLFQDLLGLIKAVFHTPVIRYTSPKQPTIQRIALCGGGGSEFMEAAVAQKADVFISADFKYHEFLAADGRLIVMDIGHFESEQFTKEIFRDLLAKGAPMLSLFFAQADQSPILAY